MDHASADAAANEIVDIMWWHNYRRLLFFLSCSLLASASVLMASVSDAAVHAPTTPMHMQYRLMGTSSTSSLVTTNTAEDAALAMNSVEFISHLASYKESDDVQSYRQVGKPKVEVGGGGSTIIMESSNKERTRSLTSWIGLGGMTNNRSNDPTESNYLSTSHPARTRTTNHETVTEYNANKIWFLPSVNKGVRFRETIRVLSISTDGRSSTVECSTQYFLGSRWVDCSRVLCKLENNIQSSGGRHHNKVPRHQNVKMSLESEVLIWLPLPKAAIRAVRKKIVSVFEEAALDFFYGLYTSN